MGTKISKSRDPHIPEPRARQVGTGAGTACSGVSKRAGAIIGSVVSGLASKRGTERVNPPEEDAFWREHFRARPYVQSGREYDEYRPAYQYGWESLHRYQGCRWEDAERDLERGWNHAKGNSRLGWNEAKDAVHDAWNRIRFGADEDREWRQMYPSYPRPGTLRVPLQELHDPGNGRLDAAKVAEYLKVSLKQLAEASGKNYSTVHKTPSALDLQSLLQSIKTSLVILEDVFVDHASVLAWLNNPHPDLGQRTPLDVILLGHPDAVKNMLQAAVMGLPS